MRNVRCLLLIDSLVVIKTLARRVEQVRAV
jgi:hypothetical protein